VERGILGGLAALAACALLASTARADAGYGAADDAAKFAPDGGAFFFSRLTDVGLRTNRMTVLWDPDRPAEIPDRAFLERAVTTAVVHGVKVVLVVYPKRARALTEAPGAVDAFVAYLQLVARAFPQVREIIVGNEFNQPRFFQPQFGAEGGGFAGGFFAGVMARAYDALKAVDPALVVIAGATNARGNDNPAARSNVSTSPVRFIRDMGAAFRASGRNRPIMDQIGFHPYPRVNTDAPRVGYAWPNAGIANLDRLKQAVWDAFHGTAQPTFEEGLRLKIDEIAWQVTIPPSLQGLYFGRETVPTLEEATQAEYYAESIRLAACDPAVSELLFFGFVDERDLDRFQGGAIRADGSFRPSYESIRAAIAETGGHCRGVPVAWRHAGSVIGASADFGALSPRPWRGRYWGLLAKAGEDYTYRAGVFRAAGAKEAEVVRGLAGTAAPRLVLQQSGEGRANRGRLVRFPRVTLPPGDYVYAVRMRAAMNPERTSVLVSRPFRVLGRR
jgi:hypothetical protein